MRNLMEILPIEAASGHIKFNNKQKFCGYRASPKGDVKGRHIKFPNPQSKCHNKEFGRLAK